MTPSRTPATLLDSFTGKALPWARPTGAPASIETHQILFGKGTNALEVALAEADDQPKVDDLRRLFKLRQANRPSPVLLVVSYPAHDGTPLTAVVGTSGDPAPAIGLAQERIWRLVAAALDEPDRHAAARSVERLLVGLKDQLTPGLVNVGLFASHELRTGVPARKDWAAAAKAAEPVLGLRGLPLIKALGYGTAQRGSSGLLLTDQGTNRAIAVLLDDTELSDHPAGLLGRSPHQVTCVSAIDI